MTKRSSSRDFRSARLERYVRGGRQLKGWRPFDVFQTFAQGLPPQSLPTSADLDFQIWQPICRIALQRDLDRVSYPGGEDRKALRLHLEDGSMAIGACRHPDSAAVEAFVLAKLSAFREVPAPYYVDRQLILQSDMGDRRLAPRLRRKPEKTAALAIDSLIALHRHASEVGLDDDFPNTGTDDWLDKLLDHPKRIANLFDMRLPDFDKQSVRDRLNGFRPRFVRWDARPGNATFLDDRQVGWFDFEAAGRRARLDDFVWLLGDENMPNDPQLEEQLLDEFLGQFADGLSERSARDYFYTYGALHCLVRASYLLAEKGNSPWSDYIDGIAQDRASIDREIYVKQCLRAARWAQNSPELKGLAPWLSDLARNVPD